MSLLGGNRQNAVFKPIQTHFMLSWNVYNRAHLLLKAIIACRLCLRLCLGNDMLTTLSWSLWRHCNTVTCFFGHHYLWLACNRYGSVLLAFPLSMSPLYICLPSRELCPLYLLQSLQHSLTSIVFSRSGPSCSKTCLATVLIRSIFSRRKMHERFSASAVFPAQINELTQ